MASTSSSPAESIEGVPLLSDRRIAPGERWLLSAGFNVARNLVSTLRIDAELDDLRVLADASARVVILSHQGRYGDGSAEHLGHVAQHLRARLGRPVSYVPDALSEDAVSVSHTQPPGSIALVGNARHHRGEEENDPALARRFAALAEFVAVGGFSKAHRSHASNVGILASRPGWATRSLVREVSVLSSWMGRARSGGSVAVVGGVKREKTIVGLPAFARDYDVVVPGGAVLNHLLRELGYGIGDSALGDANADCVGAARDVLRAGGARIHVPTRVVTARSTPNGYVDAAEQPVAAGVAAGRAIVDFRLEPWLEDELRRLRLEGGSLVVAGTPTLHQCRFTLATRPVIAASMGPNVRSLLQGGDTVAELPIEGTASAGGGSALQFLRDGDLPVLAALRAGDGAAS